MRGAHLPFRFSILCNYFAHENRNYPFCSPAFVFIFFMKEIYFLSKSHSNCFWTKNQFLICYLFKFSPSFLFSFTFLFISTLICTFLQKLSGNPIDCFHNSAGSSRWFYFFPDFPGTAVGVTNILVDIKCTDLVAACKFNCLDFSTLVN